MAKSDLVEKIDEGRKWKYYQLTRKGHKLITAGKKKIKFDAILILGIILIAAMFVFYSNPMGNTPANDMSFEHNDLEEGESFKEMAMVQTTGLNATNSTLGNQST